MTPVQGDDSHAKTKALVIDMLSLSLAFDKVPVPPDE
jgi:hypothetical protein